MQTGAQAANRLHGEIDRVIRRQEGICLVLWRSPEDIKSFCANASFSQPFRQRYGGIDVNPMLLQLLRRFNAHTQHTARQDPAHRDEQTQENPRTTTSAFSA